MRLLGQRVQGIRTLRDVSIDWDGLPGTIVALTGENGAGKSTLLECFPGGFYRKCPTRGSLADMACGKDAFVENRIVNGAPWTIRLWPGRGEAEVLDAEGRSVLGDRKVTTLDTWVKEHLPPDRVLYSSVFSPQPRAASKWSGGFLGMSPGDRKAVLLRVIGCERLERMAEAARQRAAAAKSKFELASTRLADERARGVDLAEAERAADAARAEIEQAELADKCAAEQVAIVRAEADAIAARNAEIARQAAEWHAANASAKSAEQRANTLTSRAVDLRMAVEAGAGATDAAEALAARDRDLASQRERLAGLRAEQAAAEARARSARAALQLAEQADRFAATKLEEARRADVARAAAAADAARLPEAEKALAAAEADVSAAEAALDKLRALQTSGASDRIFALRGALIWYGCDSTPSAVAADNGARAREAIGHDDEAQAALEELPATMADAVEHVLERRKALAAARAEVARLGAQKARAEAPDPVVPATEAAVAAVKALEAAREEVQQAAAHEERLRLAIVEAAASANASQAARDALAKQAAEAQAARTAAATLAEVETQIAAARAEEAAARAKASPEAWAAIPRAGTPPDVAAAERVARDTAAHVAHARAKLASAERDLERARASDARVRDLYAEAQGAEVDLADWTRLGDDLGRDGLQAVEIDAAGPELTAIVNDLLHNCVGPRWTVTISTQRAGSKKQMVEECEVRVLDTVSGAEVLAEDLSGGEEVVVGEATSLGLSVLACRRWGVERPTLVRDESGAALSNKNAEAYVAMLRRAAAQIGASRVIIVSHNPEVVSLADCRVVVAGGEVRVAA